VGGRFSRIRRKRRAPYHSSASSLLSWVSASSRVSSGNEKSNSISRGGHHDFAPPSSFVVTSAFAPSRHVLPLVAARTVRI
jgi:hypothetical protein